MRRIKAGTFKDVRMSSCVQYNPEGHWDIGSSGHPGIVVFDHVHFRWPIGKGRFASPQLSVRSSMATDRTSSLVRTIDSI